MQGGALSRHTTLKVILAFACVYLFWGSSFVAIRYSVQMVHPAFVAGIRYLIAGLVLLAFLLIRGRRLSLTRRDLLQVTGLGLLMFTCNTLLLSYGGKQLPAGLTALIISTIPLFIALLDAILPGRSSTPSLRSWIGIVTGFAGIALLLNHSLREGLLPQTAAPAAIGLLIAALAWAAGSVMLNRMTFTAPPLVATCWQMLIGGGVDVLIGLVAGGHHTSQWSTSAWLSLLFLAVFGTLAGYTSYTYLLRRVSIASVATYAYINPLVAVLLGWLLLDEPLARSQWLGLVIVLASVAMVVSLSPTTRRVATNEMEASGT
jgi:drug/metabolite transporter (DMT)-like permease